MTVEPSLFLHIQKTAGTSVVQTFRKFYGKNLISHLDYHGHKPDEFRDIGFVSGHFGYSYAQQFMKSRYSFTFLRDPIERILSFYYFCRRSNPDEYAVYKLAQEHTIDGFLDMCTDHQQVKACIWNHQTWQLACGWGNNERRSILDYDEGKMINEAMAHLAEFDYIGFVETFEKDMIIILNRLGIKRPTQIFKTNVGGPKPRIEDLPLPTRNRLRRIAEMDQLLYGFARSMRISDC